MIGLGRNPNVAAVLVVGADRAAFDMIASGIAGAARRSRRWRWTMSTRMRWR